jgi:hypothetical protein
LSLLLLEKFVLLLEDEEIVLLHGIVPAIIDVSHEFDLGVGPLSDRLDF